MQTLVVGGGGSPRTPRTRTRSGPSCASCDRVEARGHVGVRVRRPGDLVEQLRGDRADRDEAAGAGVLGDDEAAVGVHLGDREAGVREPRHLAEEACSCRRCTAAPHSMTWPATTAAASRSQSSRFQPNFHAAGPTTSAASVTRGQITTSAPRSSASTMPQPPRYAFARQHRLPAASRAACPCRGARSVSPCACSSASRGSRSSPSTCATRRGTPSFVVERARRRGAAGGIEAAGVDDDPDAALHAGRRPPPPAGAGRCARSRAFGSFSRSLSRIISVSSAR